MISNKPYAVVVIVMVAVAGIITTSSLGVLPHPVNTPLTRSVVDQLGGLEFTMTLKNTTFKIGEQINITFTVTNIGYQTISYALSFPEFDFIVYNSSNSQLYRWTSFKMFPMIVMEMDLLPGDNRTSILAWRQTCNQSESNNEGIQVSPGQYYIVGRYVRLGLSTSPLQLSIVSG